jgi:hypothetical protein
MSLLVHNWIQNNFLFSFLPSPSSSQRSRAKAGTARARPIPAPASRRPQPRTVPPTQDRCAPTATHGWARRGPQPAGHDSHSRSGGSLAAKAHQGAAGRRGQPSGTDDHDAPTAGLLPCRSGAQRPGHVRARRRRPESSRGGTRRHDCGEHA